MRTADRILGGAVLVAVLVALFMGFVYAPPEKVMGDVQRIMYFHVASAWNAFLAFFVVFVLGVLYLRSGDLRWNRMALSSAEIGVLFTTITLLTGPIWAKFAWGTWWNWEPRLTTTLILWFIYVAYLLIQSSAEGDERRARYAAVFGIIGFIDVPIVYSSIFWWRDLHPPVMGAPGTDKLELFPPMLQALIVSVLAFTLLYVFLLRRRAQMEELKHQLALLKEGLR